MPILDVDPTTTWHGTTDPVEFVVQSDFPDGANCTALGFALWEEEGREPMHCYVSVLSERYPVRLWTRVRFALHVLRHGCLASSDLELERNAIVGFAARLLSFADRMASRAAVGHDRPDLTE